VMVREVRPAPVERHYYYDNDGGDHNHHRGYFCPPGQGKKGRC